MPSNGQYPTERVQYEVLLFDEFVGGAAVLPPSRKLGEDGPLDVSQLLSNNGGYERPAIGGILTFTQSWYTKGLSLGHLIHGIALAPGESTKIAMIDWSRRVRTSATETIEEGEQLDSDLSRARSISEITSAVARETQKGESAAHSASVATQVGGSTGSAGVRSPFDPSSFGGTAAGVETSGTSFGTSTGVTDATSWSTSSGQREVGASLAQDIVDRTHQASHSARNRRASIVREVSQTESESISTRTLTNYNHMHALTVEYYEVVQLYRTIVELSKADRCLFVPMKLINFRDPAVRSRFRHVIGVSGLIPKVRALAFMEPDQVALSAPNRAGPWSERDLRDMALALQRPVGQADSPYLTLPTDFAEDFGFSAEAPIDQAIVTFASGNTATFAIVDIAELQNYWTARFSAATGDTFNVIKKGYDFSDIRRIELVKKKDKEDYAGTLSITLTFVNKELTNRMDDTPAIAMHTSVEIPKDSARFPIFVVSEAVGDEELTKHLLANQFYYSQVIWRALDPATIGILLSGYTWPVGGQAKPLVEFVDPNPVAIIANYLVLRISGDDEKEHTAWLDKKQIKIGSQREDQVPVPSGGVFAEAVLGRFNSAEKLDITRFWNWQDSPIPIQAPDIAAIQAGSRRDPDNTVPSQLSSPVLNIINPPSLPDPQGMGAILAAIQNGNMFRDMSGLAATIGLAQAGLAGAQQGATDAAAQAGKNAEVAAQFGAKLAEIAAKIVAAKFTGGASLAGGMGDTGGMINSDKGMSKAGSILNYARDMDQRGIGQTPSGQPVIPASDADSGGGVGSASYAATGAPTGGNEGAAFSMTLGGGPGGGFGQLLNTILGAAPSVPTGPSNVSDTGGRQFVRQAIIDKLRTSSRAATSFDYLVQQGWQVRKTGFSSGSRGFWADQNAKQLVIDEHDEDVADAAEKLTGAVKQAFIDNDDLRRRHERRVAIFDYFPGEQSDDLLGMGNFYSWTSWFWTIDNSEGQASPIIKDMCLVLAGRDTLNMLQSADQYYAFGTGRGRAMSRGFNVNFVDDGNQVRHAAAAINASFHPIGAYLYLIAQGRELDDALLGTPEEQAAALADISLNVYCRKLAQEIEDLGITGVKLGDAIIAKLR